MVGVHSLLSAGGFSGKRGLFFLSFRRTVRESQGRALSSQETTIEWIQHYADAFRFSEANPDR